MSKSNFKDINEKYEFVYCPFCGAYNRPILTREGDEITQVMCKSCKADMLPMIAAMKQFMEDSQKLNEGEDVERIE